MKREVRAGAELSVRLSGPLLDKKWRAHLSVWSDKKSDVPSGVPFLGLTIEVMRAPPKRTELYARPASRSHLEDDFQFHRCAQRKTCYSVD